MKKDEYLFLAVAIAVLGASLGYEIAAKRPVREQEPPAFMLEAAADSAPAIR